MTGCLLERVERKLEPAACHNPWRLVSFPVPMEESWFDVPDCHREEGFEAGLRHYYERASSADGAPPRVIFRFGHTHMGRLDYRSYASLGRYLGEFAAENGSRAFYLNLQAINEPGKYWSLTDYPEYEPLANVGDPSKWVLVDLRPARERLRADTVEASEKLTRLVFNFDAVLLIGGLSKGGKL